jgi:hypothetical protein
MTDDTRKHEHDEPYEAPKVEDLETESGPAVTAAGGTLDGTTTE